MATELVPIDKKVQNIRQLLEKSKPQIQKAFRHLDPDRMIRIAMTSIQKTPDLLKCSPNSLIGAVIQSAQLGLEPDNVLGHAYLVPFGTTCQFIVGYKGLIQLARRSGEISTLSAEVVHEGDEFSYELGSNAQLRHLPIENSGPLTAAYAVCKFKDGGVQFAVMWKSAIDKIRDRSPSGKKGPWVSDYPEMAKKTALRRLCKMLPCSVELERAVALDERAALGLSQDIDIELEAPVKPVSQLDAVAETFGEEVTAEPPDERCDEEDWKDIETLAADNKVRMPAVIAHIMETMAVVPSEKLPKARKIEVVKWITMQKR